MDNFAITLFSYAAIVDAIDWLLVGQLLIALVGYFNWICCWVLFWQQMLLTKKQFSKALLCSLKEMQMQEEGMAATWVIAMEMLF